jgi:hypothetical protein
MHLTHPTMPARISAEVLSLCRQLVPQARPVLLPVTPMVDAEVHDCFMVVERQVQAEGGETCFGWQIWEWPTLFIEGEFHAIWKNPAGALRDITPKQFSIERILFLPDPLRSYDGRQVKNVRLQISQDPAVSGFLKACDEEFELVNRGERAFEHGAICLEGNDANEMKKIQARKSYFFEQILAKPLQIGRNDLCWCGSGKKLKRCHVDRKTAAWQRTGI